MDMTEIDMTPRYAPDAVLIGNWDDPKGPAGWIMPVVQVLYHPAGTHHGPLRKDWPAIQLVTPKGSRWYGCVRAYINSELRMVVIGTPIRDEVRMQWEPVTDEML